MGSARGRLSASLLLACLLTCLLAGCGARPSVAPPSFDPTKLPPSKPSSAMAGPSVVVPTAAPAQQLTFKVPEVSGQDAEILYVVTQVGIGLESTMRKAKVSPLVARYGTASLLAFARENAAFLRRTNTYIDGPIHITLARPEVHGAKAIALTCLDGRKTVQVINKIAQPMDPPLRDQVRVSLVRSPAGWKVTSWDDRGGTPC